MLSKILRQITKVPSRKYCSTQVSLIEKQKYKYEIPLTHRESFYLANASLVENTDWFVHNALTVIYEDLVYDLEGKGHTGEEAVKLINSVVNILLPYNHIIDTNFPVKFENGEYRQFRGFRAQHGLHIYDNRPSLGGFRLCSDILKRDIKALASLATYKHACAGIDMPGAHGGIIVTPGDLKESDLQRIVLCYISELALKGFCGDAIDVFEPDMHCGSKEIKWIIAGYSKICGKKSNACAVGKPVPFGGVKNRENAVGQGILFGLNIFLNNQKIMEQLEMEVGCKNKTFILQGLGQIGSLTATYLISAGMKCICIVEQDCHISDACGINIQEAIQYKNIHKTLKGYRNMTKNSPSRDILVTPCDIILIAAGERCMPYYVTDKVLAKIIVEAANGPISPLAHKSLIGRNKLVLPDIYINSGSSIASYYEYTQNVQHIPSISLNTTCFSEGLSKLHEVRSRNEDDQQKFVLRLTGKDNMSEIIGGSMKKISEELLSTTEKYNLGIDLRTACYANAIKKLFWEAYSKISKIQK